MEVDEQDYDEGGSGVMISNLPLVFARGMPSSLKTMKLAELEQFVGFMVRCSVGEERQVPWSQLPRPLWWPKKLPFRMPSAASHNQHQSKTTLVKLADMCYAYHGCQYLLQFCHSLVEQMPDSGYRFNDNRDGTTSMYHGTTGKLLVTFRNENREYDRFVTDVPAPSPRKHNKLLPERRSSSLTTNGNAFIPPPDIYLCDKCENEFYSLKEVQAHEKKCVGEEAEAEKIPTPEPEQQEEEPEPQGQVPFLAYFKMKPAEHTGIAPYMSPRKRTHSPPRKKSFGQNYLRYDSVELASPLGRYILSNSKFGNKYQASQHLVSMRYERHLHATPNADLTYNYKDRSVRGVPDRNARSNRWIVVWREKKEEQPWCHTYPFTKHDRKEKFWALKFGLNRKSRMLYRQFSKGPAPVVKLKRLQKRVLDRYTRKNETETAAVCIDLTDEPVGQPVQPSVLAAAALLNANTLWISPAPAQRPMPASVAAAQRSGLSIRPMPASVAAAQGKPTAISPGRSSSSRPMPASVAAARAALAQQQQTAALLAQAAVAASNEEDPLQINIQKTVTEQASAMFVQQGLVNPQQLLWNTNTVSQQLAAMQLPIVAGALPNISFVPVNPVNNASALNQIGNISIKTESGVSIEKVLTPVSKIRSNQTVRTNASIEVIELSSSDDEDSNKTSRSVAANAPSQLDGLRHYPNMGAKVPDSSKNSYPKNGNSHWSSQNKSHNKTSRRVVDLATNGQPPSISASSPNFSRVESSVDPKANETLTCSVVRPNINTRRGKTPPCSHNDEQGEAVPIESGRCKTTRGKRCSESNELSSTIASEHNLSSGSLLVDSEISFKTPFQVDEEVYFMSPRTVDPQVSELSTSSSTESDDGLDNSLTEDMASSSGFVANFINKSMDFLRSLVATNTEKNDGSQSDENSPLKRELERLMKDECAELKGYKDLKDIDLRGKRFTRRSVGRELSRPKTKINRRIHRSRKIRSYPDALAVSSSFEPALMENCKSRQVNEVEYNELDKLSSDSLSFATDENGNSASYDSLHNPPGQNLFDNKKKAQAKLKFELASEPTMASEAESNGNVPSSPSKSKGKERKRELDRLQADEWKEMRVKGFNPSLIVKGEKDVNGNENTTLETKDPCLASRILEEKVGTFGELSFQTFSDPDCTRKPQDHIKAQSCSFITVDQPIQSNARPLSTSSNLHRKIDKNSSSMSPNQLKQDLVNINQEDWIEIANRQFPSLSFKLSNGEFHDSSKNAEDAAKNLSVNEVNYMTVNNFYGKPRYPIGMKITDQVSSEFALDKLNNTNSLTKSIRSPKSDLELKYLSVDNSNLNVDKNECQRQVSVYKTTSSENFYNNLVLSPTPKLCLLPKRKRSLSFEEESLEEKNITEISPNSKRKKASKCSREVARLAADEWKEIRHKGFHPADLLSNEGEIVYLQFDDDDDEDETNDNDTSTKDEEEEKQMIEADEPLNKENDVEVTKPKKLPRDLLALLSDECKEFKKPRGRGKAKALVRGRRGKEPLKLPHSRRPPSLKRLQEAYGLQSKAGRNRSGESNKPNEASTRSAAPTNAGHTGGPALIGGELPMARSTRAQTSILNCVDVITPRGAHRNIIETEGAMCVVNYELLHI